MKARAFAIAAILAAAPAVHADHALRPERIPNKARELAGKGRAYHEQGDYAAAVAAFKEAYVLAPSPGLLFNIAQSYRLAGNCDEAAWMYRRFLDTNPTGAERRLARAHLATVEKCGTGGLRVTTPAPKRDAARVPEPRVELAAANRADPRARAYKRAGIATAIGGGALLAGAALFALDAYDAAEQVSDAYEHGGTWADIEEIDARGRRSSTLATAFGIGGGVAVAAGAVLFAVGRHYEHVPHVVVAPDTRGARVSLAWRF